MRKIFVRPVALSALLSCFYAFSSVAAPAEVSVEPAVKPIAQPQVFVSKHSARFNGRSINYTATAGEVYLRDKDGEPKASIFAFAYTKNDVKADEVRPVTFIWNGGPGSASLWLHMGTFGPVRVSVPSDAGSAGKPPYPLLESPDTLLDVTDLVFIDPVGTGFSRPLGKHEGKEFWGLNEDALSMAEFVHTWTTEQGRWNSPRFLLGESYGTTRAAVVADLLESKFMTSINGIVLISQALDYTGSTPYVRDNLISHITYLPTMAAAAWYHGKVLPKPESLEAFLVQARLFAVDELMPALFKGNSLDAKTHAHIRARLAYFTGLSESYIEQVNLRVQGHRFAKELLRKEGLTLGLLDARYTQDAIDDVEADPASDAASDAISGAFNAALMVYMRRDLGVDWQRTYLASGDEEINTQWNWRTVGEGEGWEPAYIDASPNLSRVLRVNTGLNVLVASGYYDLVTPFFDAEYTLNRHDIHSDRIRYKYYGGGHMMYVNEPARVQLLKDTRDFIVEQAVH